MKKKRYRENYPITEDRRGRLFKRGTQGKNNCKYNNNENNNQYTNSGKGTVSSRYRSAEIAWMFAI